MLYKSVRLYYCMYYLTDCNGLISIVKQPSMRWIHFVTEQAYV